MQAAGPSQDEDDLNAILPNVHSDEEMADYPLPGISKNQIVKLGKALKMKLPCDESRLDEYGDVFRAAYDWRNSHYFPMRSIRREAAKIAHRPPGESFSAGRLKRMASIRKKLQNTTNTLAQMQDLGGARIVLQDMGAVTTLLSKYHAGSSRHEMRVQRDYITQPKMGGYRSYHIVFKFCGRGKTVAFDGRSIELQIRTEVQHAWSTAVEAVGLYLGQDLKGGCGDARWLRFFDLMSSEMAEYEDCPPRKDLADQVLRKKEIISLERELQAINTLRSLNEGFNHVESMRNLSKGSIMIQFDKDHNITRVDSFSIPREGADRYSFEERQSGRINSVLIDLDRVDNLQKAYPNYFLDVKVFTGHVWRAVRGYDPSFLVGWEY